MNVCILMPVVPVQCVRIWKAVIAAIVNQVLRVMHEPELVSIWMNAPDRRAEDQHCVAIPRVVFSANVRKASTVIHWKIVKILMNV